MFEKSARTAEASSLGEALCLLESASERGAAVPRCDDSQAERARLRRRVQDLRRMSRSSQAAMQAAAARHHGVRRAHRGGDRPQDAALGEVLAVRREAGGLYMYQCSGAVPRLWRDLRAVHVWRSMKRVHSDSF